MFSSNSTLQPIVSEKPEYSNLKTSFLGLDLLRMCNLVASSLLLKPNSSELSINRISSIHVSVNKPSLPLDTTLSFSSHFYFICFNKRNPSVHPNQWLMQTSDFLTARMLQWLHINETKAYDKAGIALPRA
jgi:hypothetical protein